MIVAATVMIGRPIVVIALPVHAHQAVIAPLHADVQLITLAASPSCRVTVAHVMALVRRTALRAARNAEMAVAHRVTLARVNAQVNVVTAIAKARVVSAWMASNAANVSMATARAAARPSD